MPSYLQISLETLAKEQERFRKQFAGAFTPAGAFEAYQEQARKNLAMFEQAMAMFSPFGHAKNLGAKPGEEAKKAMPPRQTLPSLPDRPSEIAELKAQLATIQSKLEKLSDDRQVSLSAQSACPPAGIELRPLSAPRRSSDRAGRRGCRS